MCLWFNDDNKPYLTQKGHIMTTHTVEGIGHRHNWGELGVRSASALKRIGIQTLTAVGNGQVAFEALMTRATTHPVDLEHAAHRAELAPPVRDRLLAQGAIHSLIEDGSRD